MNSTIQHTRSGGISMNIKDFAARCFDLRAGRTACGVLWEISGTRYRLRAARTWVRVHAQRPRHSRCEAGRRDCYECTAYARILAKVGRPPQGPEAWQTACQVWSAGESLDEARARGAVLKVTADPKLEKVSA